MKKERVTNNNLVYFGYFHDKNDNIPLFGKAKDLIRNPKNPKTVIYNDHVFLLKKIRFFQELLIEVEE